jgi:hypothetical protein
MSRFNLYKQHEKWPNAYFQRQGLFSMKHAHAEQPTL